MDEEHEEENNIEPAQVSFIIIQGHIVIWYEKHYDILMRGGDLRIFY